MVKLVVLFQKPQDTVTFDQDYKQHLDLIAKVPHLIKTEVGKLKSAPWGDPDLYLITELYFADRQLFDKGLASPEMGAAGKQLRSFAKGLFTMYIAEVQSQ
jgi:uncharacterized protein (TIGR02118 family)